MLLDSHVHLWDLTVRDQPWTAALPRLRRSFDLADLRAALAPRQVDRVILVHTTDVSDEAYEFLDIARSAPQIAAVVGWVDLTAQDVADHIAALRAAPGGASLVGVRHQVQQEPDPRWLCRPDVRRGLAVLAENELSFDVLVTPQQWPAALDTVRALPQLRFVLDHAGNPAIGDGLSAWNDFVGGLAQCDNVAVKLSGLGTCGSPAGYILDRIGPFVDALLAGFGPQRLMFGSDWPVCLLAGSYDDALSMAEDLTLGLTAAEQAAVFGGAASAWYRIVA